MLALGIDIGGTMIKTALVSETGELSEKKVQPTSRELKAQLIELIGERVAKKNVDAVGIGTAGRVDPATGSVNLATDNLTDWSGTPLKRLVEETMGISTSVLNDANAAALGEWFVNYPSVETLAMVTVGTGLGGGVVINGAPLLGKRGEAAEFGHTTLHPGGRICNCGKFGCAEQYVSMKLLHRLVEETGGRKIDRAELIEKYNAGNEFVASAVSAMTRDLAIVIDSIFLNFDPEITVVGGGISELGEKFIQELRREVSVCSKSSLYSPDDVVLAASGNDAGIIGAAVFGLKNIKSL